MLLRRAARRRQQGGVDHAGIGNAGARCARTLLRGRRVMRALARVRLKWQRLWRKDGPAGRPGQCDPCALAPAHSQADGEPDPGQGTAATVPPAQAGQLLESGFLALALQPAPGGEGTPDAVLVQATVQALAARDWSSRHLPRRPQLLPQLIQTINDPDASARLTARIISQDPVLAGNLLRIANSPAFRVQEQAVSSVHRAVTLVGTDGVRQIISAVLVQPVMDIQCTVFPDFSRLVWEHALLSSRAAADHAHTVHHADAFAAQWMGLTQGLGAVLVMRQLQQTAADTARTLDAATAGTVLVHWTLPVAQRVADAWELPQAVHDALDGGHLDGELGQSLRFARAAAAASLLCRHGRMGQSQATALLEQLPGTPLPTARWIWRRLHGRATETLADEQARDQA